MLQNCGFDLKNSDCLQEIRQEINSLPADCIVIIVNFIHSVLNADYAQIIERMKLAKDIVTNQKPERFGVNVIGEKQNILESYQIHFICVFAYNWWFVCMICSKC